jgi:hypothetical protein
MLVKLSPDGDVLVWYDQHTLAVQIGPPEGEDFREHGPNPARRQIDDAHDSSAGEFFQGVIRGQLGARPLNPDPLPEIYPEFIGGFPRLGKFFRADYFAYPDVKFLEIWKFNHVFASLRCGAVTIFLDCSRAFFGGKRRVLPDHEAV